MFMGYQRCKLECVAKKKVTRRPILGVIDAVTELHEFADQVVCLNFAAGQNCSPSSPTVGLLIASVPSRPKQNGWEMFRLEKTSCFASLNAIQRIY